MFVWDDDDKDPTGSRVPIPGTYKSARKLRTRLLFEKTSPMQEERQPMKMSLMQEERPATQDGFAAVLNGVFGSNAGCANDTVCSTSITESFLKISAVLRYGYKPSHFTFGGWHSN
jgi:hypothetical protein